MTSNRFTIQVKDISRDGGYKWIDALDSHGRPYTYRTEKDAIDAAMFWFDDAFLIGDISIYCPV